AAAVALSHPTNWRRTMANFSTSIVLSICVAFPLLAADGLAPGLVKDQPASGRFVKTDQGYMVPYKQTIPGTEATFEMQPIPGGKFKLGSPASEKGRKPDEGPQIEIEVEPFWMSTYEVTWAEYKPYMAMYTVFKKLHGPKLQPITPENKD